MYMLSNQKNILYISGSFDRNLLHVLQDPDVPEHERVEEQYYLKFMHM